MSHSPVDFDLQPITGTLNRLPDTAQASIWNFLTTYSVEAIHSGYSDIHGFAEDYCLYSAAVRSLKFAADPEAVMEKENMQRETIIPGWQPADAWRYPHVDEIWPPREPEPVKQKEKAPDTVGFVYLTESQYPGSMNLGIVILPQFRQYGFATEAVRKVLKVAFADFGCHRIQAQIGVPDRNERTRLTRLFTFLGFKHEGINRRALHVPQTYQSTVEDEWRDVTTLALLDTDFITLLDRPILPVSYVKMQWEELFMRHERERECMLEVEEHADVRRQAIRRTSGTEAIKREGSLPEKAQIGTSSQPFGEGPSLPSPISSPPQQVAFGNDEKTSHIIAPRASSATNVDVVSVLRQVRLSRRAEGSDVGSRQGSESPESSEAGYSDSYSSPPPGSPLSYSSRDSDAESDWTSASHYTRRGSQSGESDWDMLE